MRGRTWRRRPRRTPPPRASRTGSGSATLSPSGKDSRRGEGAPSRTRSRDGRTSSLCAQASRAPFRKGRPAPPPVFAVSTFLSCADLVICCLAYHTPETKKCKRPLVKKSKKIKRSSRNYPLLGIAPLRFMTVFCRTKADGSHCLTEFCNYLNNLTSFFFSSLFFISISLVGFKCLSLSIHIRADISALLP